MIPAEFTGGWQRGSITLDGGEPAETMRVWWLQSSSKHADLRIPLDDATEAGAEDVMAFAGTTTWVAPSLTWHPEVELAPSVFEDTGVVTWDGPDLLEAGESEADGRAVRYVERWQRLPDTAGPLLSLSKPGGQLVRTGSLALTIVDERAAGGAFHAVAWRLTADGWTIAHRWPSGAVATPPPTRTDLSIGESVRLDDGSLWRIDEVAHA